MCFRFFKINHYGRNIVSVLLLHTHKVHSRVFFGIISIVILSVILFYSYGISSYARFSDLNILEAKSTGKSGYSSNGQEILSQHGQGRIDHTPCSELTTTVNECEMIHLVVVCAGFNSSRTAMALFKSILYNRKNPLSFHIVVNDQSKLVLSTLFEGWDIPSVVVKFYSTELFSQDVSWVPNEHYSGIFGLIKLSLISNLPNYIRKIIILDTDVIFNSDIAQLWAHFKHMTKQQVLGLVENQSDWYLGKFPAYEFVWPAIGRGFNTGVILVQLDSLSDFDWKEKWTNVTENTLKIVPYAQLADQDILNAVVKEYPHILYKLPCCWNIQLSICTISSTCYNDIKDIKTLHWNAPYKLNVKNRHGEFFRRLHNKYLEYDGSLLRREISCGSSELPKNDTLSFPYEDANCYEFYRAAIVKYRTHLFFLSNKGPNPISKDITLVMYLTMDRLQMIEQIVRLWDDAISFTIYLTDAEALQLVSFYETSPEISLRTNVVFHVVYKEGTYFPENYLRNVGIRNVNTSYLFLSDIDFLPKKYFTSHFMKSIQCATCDDSKTVFIVPAFSAQQLNKMPRSKGELKRMLAKGNMGYYNTTSQQVPSYLRQWNLSRTPYKINWQEIASPVMVVRRYVPLYDTRFAAFGWNKESHLVELQLLQYNFFVLPLVYAVQKNHLPRIDTARLQSSNYYRECFSIIQEEFMNELKVKYDIGFNHSKAL